VTSASAVEASKATLSASFTNLFTEARWLEVHADHDVEVYAVPRGGTITTFTSHPPGSQLESLETRLSPHDFRDPLTD
jgi:hypothetical protein